MKFEEMTIKEYEDILAAKKSTPGGGSCLALVLVNAISLCQMVYNFTLDKKGYESVRDEIIKINDDLENLKKDAYRLMNEDSESFIKLMDAYKTKDEAMVSKASIDACEVPYELFMKTKIVEKYAEYLSSVGNVNVISDSKIAYDLCKSIYNGCIMNIKANVRCILDEEIASKYKAII